MDTMWPETENVKEIELKMTAIIRSYTHKDGSVRYDWITDDDESYQWFETADEAESSIRSRYN